MKETILSLNGLFLIIDDKGDISGGKQGLYAFDTRFINKTKLIISFNKERDNTGIKPILHKKLSQAKALTSFLKKSKDGNASLLVIREHEVLHEGKYLEKINILNLNNKNIRFELRYHVRPSFEDIFEVRGSPQTIKRTITFSLKNNDEFVFFYNGIDGILRGLKVKFSEKVSKIRKGWTFLFSGNITNRGSQKFEIIFKPFIDPNISARYFGKRSYSSVLEGVSLRANKIYEKVFESFIKDIKLLTYMTEYGPIPLAGLPNFACLFGRDSIISSLFLLPFEPRYARAVLRVLSKLQGKSHNPKRDEEPGKIIHELRLGELSRAGILPFSPYYGSVDSTPLYIMLAWEYYRWTGDLKLIKELKENLLSALNWILFKLEEGEGLIRYEKKAEKGLDNQGWKDSGLAIIDESGRPLTPPIALVEVQGYAYEALNSLSLLEDYIGVDGNMVKREASKLKTIFNRLFWLPELKYYALALDCNNKPSRVISSNPAHLLLTNIAEKCEAVANRLFKEDMFSGWGVRTLSSEEVSYDPFSYHNGSVWPHDNGLAALGLSLKGFKELAVKLSNSMITAAFLMEGHRLPEFFSGIDRKLSEIPIPVPGANAPQAWSATSIAAFLTSIIGLEPVPEEDKLLINPELPDMLRSIEIRGIKLRGKELNLSIARKEYGEYCVKAHDSSNVRVEVRS